MTLTVQDESGFANDRHTDRIVVRVDESPIAEAGPDQEVCAGAEVHFDGSASRDFDGVVNRFTWDFGDGNTGGGESRSTSISQPGDYRVVLTIEGDQAGQCDNTDTDEMTVRVVEAPVARIVGPSASRSARRATFDASQSSGATGRDRRAGAGISATAPPPRGPTVEHAYREARRLCRPARRSRPMPPPAECNVVDGAALRRRQRAAGRRCRRGPPGRGRPGGPVRRLGVAAIRTARSPPGSGTSATARPRPA